MAELKLFPIGLQDFSQIRRNGYYYVDKTDIVYKMTHTDRVYFLSRPRRFGKSLLISTLRDYFLGKKELFTGLAIEKLEKEWKQYPVFHLSFAGNKFTDLKSLQIYMNFKLSELEKIYKVTNTNEYEWGPRFEKILKAAYEQTGTEPVVLVDEYDAPLLDTMDNPELQLVLKQEMRKLFSPLKDIGGILRFVFLTGISKFSQLSIFSELNNLNVITMDNEYASICGITKEELFEQMKPEIQALAENNDMTYDEACAGLTKKYDGYHFTEKSPDIYNPFSLLNTLQSTKMRDYWFQTGTPTFLVQEIKRNNYDLRKLIDGVDVDSQRLTEYSVGGTNPIPILVQSGYLTIKGYDSRFDTYHLELPNEEVKYGFLNFLSPDFIGTKSFSFDSDFDVRKFVKDIESCNVDAFMTRLQSIIASLPYPTDAKNQTVEMLEYNFQVAVYLTFTLMGQFTQCEVHSIKGRADAVVETQDAVFIFEFKTNDSAENALAQIDELCYAEKYNSSSKQIVKIGAEFNTQERKLVEWVKE